MQNSMIRWHPGVVGLVSFAIVVAPLLVASEASAAVSIKRAELSGQNPRVEGQGARCRGDCHRHIAGIDRNRPVRQQGPVQGRGFDAGSGNRCFRGKATD